jgi:hypothetical protein
MQFGLGGVNSVFWFAGTPRRNDFRFAGTPPHGVCVPYRSGAHFLIAFSFWLGPARSGIIAVPRPTRIW